MSVITSAQYTTRVEVNLLDEGIDRYFGIDQKFKDGIAEIGMSLGSSKGRQFARRWSILLSWTPARIGPQAKTI